MEWEKKTMEWEKETVHTLRTKDLTFSFTENGDDEEDHLLIEQNKDGTFIVNTSWDKSFKQLKHFVHGFLVGQYSKKTNDIITDLEDRCIE